MKELQQRKKNRLEGYDYSASGAYFVTICALNRYNIFRDEEDYWKIAEYIQNNPAKYLIQQDPENSKIY